MKMIRNKNEVMSAKLLGISQIGLSCLGAALRSRKTCTAFSRKICERTGSLLKRKIRARELTPLGGWVYQRLRERATARAFSLEDSA